MKQLIGQALRFGIVGGLATAVNFLLFLGLLHLLNVNSVLSSAGGYIGGLLLGFPLNRKWTFKSEKKGTFIKYICVYMVSLGTSLLLFWLLNTSLQVNVHVTEVITVCYTTGVNFIGTKLWVFRLKDQKLPA